MGKVLPSFASTSEQGSQVIQFAVLLNSQFFAIWHRAQKILKLLLPGSQAAGGMPGWVNDPVALFDLKAVHASPVPGERSDGAAMGFRSGG